MPEWIPYKDYSDLFLTELGEIKIIKKDGSKFSPKLYLSYKKTGYLAFRYKREQILFHRALCWLFHGPAPEGKPLALHRDDDRYHNSKENLYWGDHQDNADDRIKNDRQAYKICLHREQSPP